MRIPKGSEGPACERRARALPELAGSCSRNTGAEQAGSSMAGAETVLTFVGCAPGWPNRDRDGRGRQRRPSKQPLGHRWGAWRWKSRPACWKRRGKILLGAGKEEVVGARRQPGPITTRRGEEGDRQAAAKQKASRVTTSRGCVTGGSWWHSESQD